MEKDKAKALDVKLRNSLRPLTRRQRRHLLVTSFFVALAVHTGFIPKKIPGLGIELSEGGEAAFLVFLAVAVIYFFFAFLTYATADYLARGRAIDQSDDDGGEFRHPVIGYGPFVRTVAWARVFFDYWIPLLAGLAALQSLFWGHPAKP